MTSMSGASKLLVAEWRSTTTRRRAHIPSAGGPVSLRPSGRPSRRPVPLLRRVRAAAAIWRASCPSSSAAPRPVSTPSTAYSRRRDPPKREGGTRSKSAALKPDPRHRRDCAQGDGAARLPGQIRARRRVPGRLSATARITDRGRSCRRRRRASTRA